MKRLLYIYNPLAGQQRAKAILPEVMDVFARQDYEITVHPTLEQGDAAKTVAERGTAYDRIVCCGGDGTLNEVVRGILALPAYSRPVVGYIPTGTTNDFSRTLELPKGVAKLAEMAGADNVREVDVGLAEGKPFTYVAAFGLFTDVSYCTPQASKNLLGHFAYVLEGAGKLANVPSYHMEVSSAEGVRIEGDFIYGMVSNTVSVGGMINLPKDRVRLDDGQFEIVLIRQPRTLKDWQDILAALGNPTLEEDGAVTSFSSSEVSFRCDKPVAWTVDGEFGGEQAETTVRNIPRALALACGR